MSRRLVLWGFTVFVFAGFISSTAAETPGTVVLSLEEFDALRAKPELALPAFAVPEAGYWAEVSGSRLRVHARLRVDVIQLEDWTFVPLCGKEIVIKKATINKSKAVLVSNEKGEVALIAPQGGGDLELEFYTEIREDQGYYVAEFAVPPAGIATLAVDFPYDDVRAHLNGQLVMTSLDEQQHSVFEASVGSTSSLQLRWIPLPKELEPHLIATDTLFVRHEEDSVDYRVMMDLYVTRRPLERMTIPLEDGLVPISVTGDNGPEFDWSPEAVTIEFEVPILGEARVELKLERLFRGEWPESLVVAHPFPREASRVRGFVAFAASESIWVVVDQRENLELSSPDRLPDKDLRSKASQVFYFHSATGEWALGYHLEKVVPEFTAAAYNTVTFGETTCIVDSQFECLVQQGAMEYFVISQVPGFRLESVGGSPVRDWTAEPGTEHVRVLLNRAERGKITFSANFRKTYQGGQEIPIRFPEISEAKRIRGFVTVRPQTSVKLSALGVEGLEVLDPSEVPLAMQTAGGGGARYAYRYLSQPTSLTLGVERFEGIELEDSMIQRMLTRVTYSIQGTVRSESTLEVLNADMDLLSLQIGDGATVRGARLGEAPVTPAASEEPGTVLIPLPRSKTEVSRLSLAYLSTGEPLERRKEVVLPIPLVTLPIDDLVLQVIPPAGYEVDLLSEQVVQPVPPPGLEELPASRTKMHWMSGPGVTGTVPDKGAEAEMKKIGIALETYYIDHNQYPPSLQNLTGPIDYLKGERVAIGKYAYETDAQGLSMWKLGVELPYYPGEESAKGKEQGVYFEGRLLRGDPEAMSLEDMLKVEVRLTKKRGGLFRR